MKRTFCIVFFFQFMVAPSYAQTFNLKSYANRLDIFGSPAMLVEDSVLYSFSMIDGSHTAFTYKKFSRQGQLLDSNYYDVQEKGISLIGMRRNMLQRISGSSLLCVQDFFNSARDTTFPRLYKINNDLDTLYSVKLDLPGTTEVNSFDVLVDSNQIVLLGHYANIDLQLGLYIARYDTALNLLGYSTIRDFRPIYTPGYGHAYFPYRLRRMADNYYITGRCFYVHKFVESFLVKTDLLGNKIWDKRYKYLDSNTVSFEILPIGQDSLFQASIYRSKYINGNGYNRAIFRVLDSNCNVWDSIVYPAEETQFEFTNAIRSADGAILLTGFYYLDGTKGFIWKLDKNLNTIWRRVYYHGDWEDSSWLYNIDQWNDDGIITTGTYFDRYLNPSPYSVYVWLLSLDDSGCLGAGDCGSDISFVEWVLPEQGLSVYPNPAHDYLNLEMGLPECQNMQGTAHIFSLDGELVLEEKVQFFQGKLRLDVSKLNQGQYVLELKTNTSLFMVRVLIH
ncbi:T9SS type A sorting domain-containing protein [Croceimicrobium hydrocarbonivorans]|uniref:T9SS type A sorting domain-containing protein n=1 Tax=Croceimicrobium hydrocarbonivorans TaxID=2761580 RepID=A0A7H0VE91_9FLAO|nr:T9SS type A sorting domain-containing protein [Croceimicrobium hydrocarbonivorans]QNR24039.1 T9SS type A sorting domain-containing protein [Croceimicrobium hydrocarbonivorans]